jgi:hypothetical protein
LPKDWGMGMVHRFLRQACREKHVDARPFLPLKVRDLIAFWGKMPLLLWRMHYLLKNKAGESGMHLHVLCYPQSDSGDSWWTKKGGKLFTEHRNRYSNFSSLENPTINFMKKILLRSTYSPVIFHFKRVNAFASPAKSTAHLHLFRLPSPFKSPRYVPLHRPS